MSCRFDRVRGIPSMRECSGCSSDAFGPGSSGNSSRCTRRPAPTWNARFAAAKPTVKNPTIDNVSIDISITETPMSPKPIRTRRGPLLQYRKMLSISLNADYSISQLPDRWGCHTRKPARASPRPVSLRGSRVARPAIEEARRGTRQSGSRMCPSIRRRPHHHRQHKSCSRSRHWRRCR